MSHDKSDYDEGYDDGYEAGRKQRLDTTKMQERYSYLKRGGEWQKRTDIESDKYLAGFLDAMKVLGVKP